MGSSGTAKALAEILELNQLNPVGTTGITRKGLEKLREVLLRAGHINKVKLEGLKADRIPVMPGGFSIMAAVFAELNIEHMEFADGALRLGVLYDLLGREQSHDMRELTVAQFMQRYKVDAIHANAVAQVVGQLTQKLPDINEHERHLLHWAALLHEVGVSIAHASYHKHSAYMLTHADMPGFSKRDQLRLANLVLAHTGKLAKLARGEVGRNEWLLVLCLRLAFLFCRRRGHLDLPKLSLTRDKNKVDGYNLQLPADFLQTHPLTDYSLKQEADEWAKLGIQLTIN